MKNITHFPADLAIRRIQYSGLLELKIEFAGKSKIPGRGVSRLLVLTALLLFAATTSLTAVAAPGGSHVSFNDDGIALASTPPTGRDAMLKADDDNVQVRVRTSPKNKSGLIIAINTTPKFVQTAIHLDNGAGELTAPFEGRTLKPSPKGDLIERFPPYGVHVYTWGPEPQVVLAREQR